MVIVSNDNINVLNSILVYFRVLQSIYIKKSDTLLVLIGNLQDISSLLFKTGHVPLNYKRFKLKWSVDLFNNIHRCIIYIELQNFVPPMFISPTIV